MKRNSSAERFMETVSTRLGPVMGAIDENKTVQAIVSGMTEIAPVSFAGAAFLLLLLLVDLFPSPDILREALQSGYTLTLGILGVYASISIGIMYARLYRLNQLNAALICLAAFLLVSIRVDPGTTSLPVANLGASGIFPAVLTTIIVMRLYRFREDRKGRIKVPAGVPPMIAELSSVLLVTLGVLLPALIIRYIFDFDLASALYAILSPIFSLLDNVFIVTLRIFMGMLFWAAGLQGEAIFSPILTPFLTTWQLANASAAVNGQPLPYIWTTTFERMVLWVPSVWGVMFWMYLSKVKSIRSLAIAATPASLFTIVEPIIFGLPIAFNAYLIIPFILSSTLATIISYLGTTLGLFGRFYVGLPWFTPPPILAVLDSGVNWANLLMVLVNFLIGVLLYWPFFKAFEKKELLRHTDPDLSTGPVGQGSA